VGSGAKILFGQLEIEAIVWFPIIAGSLLVAASVFLLSVNLSRSVEVGIGIIPFILFLAAIVFFQCRSDNKYFTDVPIWHHVQYLSLFIAPNYLVAFVISSVALARSHNTSKGRWQYVGELIFFIAIHVVGLSWAAFILNYKGSI
jgi:hypothetical protein